ncbi:hypothetical protein J1N35_040285 [Gossypium stocksii]|uniref:RNase H type-1 domain-containing protein n=1 Tax=Gossypium stocksii TaxID=47602 RepID=A0A9D3UDP7_9ROSI|nr:hypothetical protein J1N35_040285 [Gossypium stocksii]
MVVELLIERDENCNQPSLVRRFREVCSKKWTIRIQHVCSEANTIANVLAKPCPLEEIALKLLESPSYYAQQYFVMIL